jgi:hypothetical protein
LNATSDELDKNEAVSLYCVLSIKLNILLNSSKWKRLVDIVPKVNLVLSSITLNFNTGHNYNLSYSNLRNNCTINFTFNWLKVVHMINKKLRKENRFYALIAGGAGRLAAAAASLASLSFLSLTL